MRKKTWPLQEQGQFLWRLGQLLEKGYSLSQAIEFLEIQQPVLRRRDLQHALSLLRSGFAFYKVLEALSFHSEAVGSIFFAEQHGDLAQGLAEAGKLLLSRARYWQRIRKAARYPLFLLCAVAIMLAFIQQLLLPQFVQLSSSLDSHRFSFSQIILQLFSIFPSVFTALSFLIGAAIAGYYFWLKKLPPIEQIKIYLRIPFVRHLSMLYHTHLFALQFSHLLNSGLSVYEALQVFEKQENVPFLRAEGAALKEQLVKGQRLEEMIGSRSYYEKELGLVIRHGQSNGELAMELFHYSRLVLEKLEEKLEKWTRTIQPILFSFIGLLIVLMYLSILLPMFEAMNK
ncbi:competence type IV pilus assembly protein ComGB [Anoxybacillus rupiensis]|uniref:Competence type IV pilus assembly protein ComGB n=1 Tax=Anoxybacteroides rupiense TaxID=311460 RepID=A0ABD5ITT2_9BACL|nr:MULTISPECIES: competence type IV pilus assembly protein ComGB [Anoxybacillus]KXG11261.1 hypothetical protein AT864_00344 [Anoxybacillus sp. P3H1B]MBB3906839.1 competence protein ComGB [Anoxybacillus rupiensis]MBS2770052.1 type II secretion system F family protein [Anoxybacillus rupiensis]MDE8562575.1 competence type IV pilus assembly protein ComGB [Anoxybacillus rupiensis]MED5050821.1 competence type IV pilus assembly protein ComGB [Anoxybacillus rupiensis]